MEKSLINWCRERRFAGYVKCLLREIEDGDVEWDLPDIDRLGGWQEYGLRESVGSDEFGLVLATAITRDLRL